MAGDYSSYGPDDFLREPSFSNWANGRPSPEYSFWEQYRLDHPEQEEAMRQAAQLIQDLKTLHEEPYDQDMEEDIWAGIQKELKPRRILSLGTAWKAAASVALLVMGWWAFHQFQAGTTLKQETAFLGKHTERNTGNTPKELKLADGSVILLQPNSSLSYGDDFNGTVREVVLEGEAFFDIARNPGKPFIVFANQVVTKVLGTSFTIKAYEKESDITVAVRTGRVSVQSREAFDRGEKHDSPDLPGLILTPNQQAVYVKKEEQLRKTLVEQPLPVAGQKAAGISFNFENKPLSEVFATLSRAYGVEIIYDEEIFGSCSLTVGLEDESLFEKLKIICKTIDATYQVIDTRVLISGKGCKF